MNPFAAIGLLINSALYLLSIVWVGMMLVNHLAVYLAVATFGINYLGYFVNGLSVPVYRPLAAYLATILVYASIAFGAAAGVALLVR